MIRDGSSKEEGPLELSVTPGTAVKTGPKAASKAFRLSRMLRRRNVHAIWRESFALDTQRGRVDLYVQKKCTICTLCQFIPGETHLKCTKDGASSGVQMKTTLSHRVSVSVLCSSSWSVCLAGTYCAPTFRSTDAVSFWHTRRLN